MDPQETSVFLKYIHTCKVQLHQLQFTNQEKREIVDRIIRLNIVTFLYFQI